MSLIHPTAVIEKGAELGDNVSVGAFAYIGSHVTIGDDTSVASHAVLRGSPPLANETVSFPMQL